MNNNIILNIADFNFKINFRKIENIKHKKEFKKNILKKYSGFIKKNNYKKIDYVINVVSTITIEIIYKKETGTYFFSTFCFKNSNTIETNYHISFSQFSVIIREALQKLLIKNNGFLLHGSAVAKNSMAYIFTGHSGAGKSTIMKLLSSCYKSLGDDSVIIKKENNKFYLYQTPLFEKNWLDKDYKKYEIKGIYFLKKAKQFKIERIYGKNHTIIKLTGQLLASNKYIKDTKIEFRQLTQFIKNFDNFNFLYFDKNQEKLLKFFKTINYYGQI